MKKIALVVSLCCALGAVAQNKSTIETRALIENYSHAKSVDKMSKKLLNRFPLRSKGETTCIGVLAKVNSQFDRQAAAAVGIRVTSEVDDIVAMRVPLSRLSYLEQCAGIEVFSVAHRATLEMNNTRFDTHTDSVQAGVGVPMPFNGAGVIIGITDWGFDYTHPNLSVYNNRRILRAWDHYKLSGPAPDGFDYGTEFVGYDELKAAKGDTSGLYGYGTHGTHVAGICAGNGINGNAIGQAPGAEMLLGSWLLDEASWLDQVAWMYRVSRNEGKRLVINSSWGMYTFSTLDGTSLLSQGIDHYSDKGVVFVTSGGNNGDNKYHIRHVFGNDDTLRSVAAWYSGGIGQALVFWGEPGEDFQAGFAMMSTTDQSDISETVLFPTTQDIPFYEGFIITSQNDTIHYDVLVEHSNPLDARPHVLLNVEKNNDYRIVMQATADSNTTLNVFNINNMLNHAGNVGCPFTRGNIPDAATGDDEYGIGEPACSHKAIGVAAHVADRINNNTGELTEGTLTSFSSHGPTLDGRNKPEISAPGSNVISSLSSYSDLSSYSAVYFTMSNGRRYIWGSMSGTSMSGPAVTGIVALMLQANPNLSVDDIRNILFRTARNDSKTGPLHANDSMSLVWGWGKIDALAAVNAAYDKLSVEEAIAHPAPLMVYPNPTAHSVTLLTSSNEQCAMELYDMSGRRMLRGTVSDQSTVDLSPLAPGVYYIKLYDRTGVRTAKVVKQ
ncbi:MAG: S8 family peptidase [Bacteroidales bacterium]|nr:S8 family peptidase [Bacteroidales bacterium]